jgi:hypothetical protein
MPIEDDDGSLARLRIISNSVEHVEFVYLRYVRDFQKEGVVFGFNILEESGRMLAESIAGKEAVQGSIDRTDTADLTPVFWCTCGVISALKWIEVVEPEIHRDLASIEWPDEKFLLVGASHENMLVRWLDKPSE